MLSVNPSAESSWVYASKLMPWPGTCTVKTKEAMSGTRKYAPASRSTAPRQTRGRGWRPGREARAGAVVPAGAAPVSGAVGAGVGVIAAIGRSVAGGAGRPP